MGYSQCWYTSLSALTRYAVVGGSYRYRYALFPHAPLSAACLTWTCCGVCWQGLDNIRYNPEFQPLVKLIPQIKDKAGDKVESPTDLLAWVRPYLETGGYFTYAGSLTTPPYTENVRWIVYDNPILISHAQVSASGSLGHWAAGSL